MPKQGRPNEKANHLAIGVVHGWGGVSVTVDLP